MREQFESPTEIPKEENFQNGALKKNEQPDALIKKIDYLVRANFGKIEIKGEENLQLISPDKKIIFVPTHLSDFDVPIVLSVVGKRFHVAVGDASTHHKFSENPMAFIGNKIAGENNFFPVEHHKNSKGVEKGQFNPEDFKNMEGALRENKALVLSAYYKGGQEWELPEKGGYGAVYLAEISGALLIPVAVNVQSAEQVGMGNGILKTLLKRSNAEVVIGEPVELEKIDGVERIKEIMEKRKKGEKLSHEEVSEFHELRLALRKQSDIIMRELADLLPKEKRGKWDKEIDNF